MQDAAVPDPGATGRTREGGQLFRCKIVNFHSDRMRPAAAAKQFNLAHFYRFFGTLPYELFSFGAESGLAVC